MSVVQFISSVSVLGGRAAGLSFDRSRAELALGSLGAGVRVGMRMRSPAARAIGNVSGSCYGWVVSEETVFPPFRVSEAAVSQIVAVGGSVRMDITAGGCCGRTYVFTADGPVAGDEVFGCPGAVLAVSPVAVAVMTGARLDYGAALKPPRFRVLANPNTPLRCPCGRSFGAVWPGPGQPGCRAYVPMPWD